jgi:uncharacterized membrane protein YqjE
MTTREQQPSDTQQELSEQSTGDLVKQLSQQVSTLVRQEVELAKVEMADKGKKAGVGLGMFGGAGVAALLALGALTAFLILVLHQAIPAWAAALVVTVIWAAVAGVLALQGREKVKEVGTPIPEQTAESVKEDVEWLKGNRT